MDIQTQRVIFWLDAHDYSKQHWETVAREIYDQCDGDLGKSIEELAKAIQSFHHKFQDAVVKPGNVLHEFIEMGLAKVDWIEVARTRFKQYEN